MPGHSRNTEAKNRLVPRPADLGTLRPEEAAEQLRHLPGLVFLDTAAAGEAGGARDFSLITAAPRRIVSGRLDREDDLEGLRHALRTLPPAAEIDLGIPAGGAFGFVGFDGAFRFGLYDQLLAYSHGSDEWFEIGALSREFQPPRPVVPHRGGPPLALEFETPPGAFVEAVRRAKEYIAAGDIYQVNLSHRARAAWRPEDDPFELYRCLRESSPAPYAAYLETGEGAILSSSPELFLRMSARLIRTRPIKGTRPRFRDPGRDEKSAYDLITSGKEIAELIMITDLERNDLGRVSDYGTVRATELLKLERFAQVFHLVSTVEGSLRDGIDHLEALRSCFPGGSISGAPKQRALEIIAELEPAPRDLYTGAIGYLGRNGESQFNIAIRTGVVRDDSIEFHVGAGIVADSEPPREYQETLDKAAGMLRAVALFNERRCGG